MGDWPALPHVIDAVIVVTLIEAAVLFFLQRRGRGVAPRDFVLNIASGLSLMLALRCALASAGWPWILGFVLLAGLLHAADLWRRWH